MASRREKIWPGVHPALEAAAKEAFAILYPGKDVLGSDDCARRFRRLVRDLAGRNPEDVTWDYVCEDVRGHRHIGSQWMTLLSVMIERGLYGSEHREALTRLKPAFERNAAKRITALNGVFCGGDVDFFHLIEKDDGSDHRAVLLRYENPAIAAVVAPFLRGGARFHLRPSWLLDRFEDSLGALAAGIGGPDDFGDATLWAQVEYCRSTWGDDPRALRMSIAFIQDFYRFLAASTADRNVFGDSTRMSLALLMDDRLHRVVADGYSVEVYRPGMDLGAAERVVLIFRGYGSLSTRASNDEYRFVDLSSIPCALYRAETLRYWTSSPRLPIVQGESELQHLKSAAAFLCSLKGQEGYPNPKPDRLTNQEAVLLREFIGASGSLGYRNAKIGAVRRFLQWERDSGGPIAFDDLFFDYLTQYEEPARTGGEALSADEVAQIARMLAEKAESDHVSRLCLAILQLILETEFRVSQICGLEVDCVRPAMARGRYEIRSTSKTSNGMVESFTVTEITRRHLATAIACTDGIRAACPDEETARRIFLYEGDHGARVMSAAKFSGVIKSCCKELGFEKHYTASNLRDTHMTLALEHVMRNGKSEAELLVLTRHKHVDTSKSSYIELEIEKMLESTHGIIIGGSSAVDPSASLVDRMPPSALGAERVVAGGCGSCSADRCDVTSPLPCLVCGHFVTTVAHEPFFVKAIESIDALIDKGGSRHDIEDLTTVKLLHALYLKAIYVKKEHSCTTRQA